MRTIIIWDNVGVEPIEFFILEGDYRHLNRVYINSVDDEQAKQDELSDLIYRDDGSFKLPLRQHSEEFPLLQPGDFVIVAGFLP